MLSNKEIGDRIKTRRKMLGMSLQQVAQEISIVKSTLSRYECGAISTPSMPTLRAISEALRVDIRWLIGEQDDMLAPAAQTPTQEVGDIIAAAKAQLSRQKGLLFDGKPASDEAIASILDAMEIGLTMARKKNSSETAINTLRDEISKL